MEKINWITNNAKRKLINKQLAQNTLGYFSTDITCSGKRATHREQNRRKTDHAKYHAQGQISGHIFKGK